MPKRSSLRNATPRAEQIGQKFHWPDACWIKLIEFTESILAQEVEVTRWTHRKHVVEAVTKALRVATRGIPKKHRELSYRSNDGAGRVLDEEILACRDWINRRITKNNQLPLKTTSWIVWNLAPFFRQRRTEAIAWRDLIRFLNCVPFSNRLAGKRKGLAEETPDEAGLLALEAKRMKSLYDRTPQDTARHRKIEHLLSSHLGHRVKSPNKRLHARAFERLKRLTS